MVGSRVYYRRKLAKTAKRMQIAHNSALRWTPISPVETAGWINWTTTSMWEETLGPQTSVGDLNNPYFMRQQLKAVGEMVASITVFELPPSDSSRSVVSFESRYGTCVALPSERAAMTLPRAERERLILII